jgi:hypothetical protein
MMEISMKLKNRRVNVKSLGDGCYEIAFRILTDDLSERTTHNVERNKIVTTTMALSKEAAFCLCLALKNQLEKDEIKGISTENS